MQWSKEKAWEWYNARPWMRGCCYIGADCVNRIEQWQELGFEKRWEATEREIALMQKTGFNTVRLGVEHIVWLEEHDGFMERFERYISLFAKYGISCMITLANDCMPPKNSSRKPHLGEQTVDWGYHGGKTSNPCQEHSEPAPHFYLDEPETREKYFDMVREIVTKYKDDERICIWDVYNEPGGCRRQDITIPNVKAMFELVRSINPSQPLTAGVFTMQGKETPFNEVEQYVLDESDIVSYHYYGDYASHVKIIKRLQRKGRPVINTEWLARCLYNDVFSNFPLFYLEKIGCYNWGFVQSRFQGEEPWEGLWQQYESGQNTNFDFTKWFHGLYRRSHRPYDPKEIKLIRDFCDLADKDFEREKNQ